MSEFINDFIIGDERIDLQIEGYPEDSFIYKPTTAGEENKWLPQYTYLDDKGKPKSDIGMLNKLKIQNLVGVPYDKADVKVVLGPNKEFEKLTLPQRWEFLAKLKGGIMDKIVIAMNKHDAGNLNLKKN